MEVFKFYPENRAKFHFGDSRGKLRETVSSNRLFSALYNNIILLYGPDEIYLKEMLNSIYLSSLFYGMHFYNTVTKKREEIFFLPRPLAPIKNRNEDDLTGRKKEKKIKYLSIEAFKLLQKSWKNEEEYFDFTLNDLQILGSKYACTK